MNIELDYEVVPQPRWGYGRVPHPQLTALLHEGRGRFMHRLGRCLSYRQELARISTDEDPAAPLLPAWNNPWFSGLDAVALYSAIRAELPRLYLEIGSGVSTKFARQAISDGALSTRVVSLDPHPRAEIDELCDEVIRERLENLPSTVFDLVRPGDVVFMDGSHRVFTNSDTTVFFLEILPRLPPGVFVHMHDIFLPYDYPPDWSDRFYSEQYVLASMLLSGCRSVQVELPVAFICNDSELRGLVAPAMPDFPAASWHVGSSFWLKTLHWRKA